MATARATIRLALRKLGVLGLNRRPDAAQEAEALDALNRVIKGWIGFGASHPVTAIRVDSAYEVRPNAPAQRLLCVNGGIAVTLPKSPMDGARVGIVDVAGVADASAITFNPNGMAIEGDTATLTLNTAGINRVWMFRADLGDWKRATDLTIDADLPFPDELDDDIARLLAHYSQSLFDAALPEPEARMVNGSLTKLRARYVKPPRQTPDGAVSSLGGASWPIGYSTEDNG